jgi:hypothetical protein
VVSKLEVSEYEAERTEKVIYIVSYLVVASKEHDVDIRYFNLTFGKNRTNIFFSFDRPDDSYNRTKYDQISASLERLMIRDYPGVRTQVYFGEKYYINSESHFWLWMCYMNTIAIGVIYLGCWICKRKKESVDHHNTPVIVVLVLTMVIYTQKNAYYFLLSLPRWPMDFANYILTLIAFAFLLRLVPT